MRIKASSPCAIASIVAGGALSALEPGAAHADDGGLACGGFETCEFVPGFPDRFGVWGTDIMDITGAQQGVTPLEGEKMLHFQCIGFEGSCHSPGGISSDTQQLIDLSPFADIVAGGNAVVTAAASFNRVAGDAQTDTEFRINLLAYDGQPANYPNDPLLETASTVIFSDGDTATWELATVNLAIPADTTYLAVGLSAVENIFNDGFDGPSFDGHYADGVTLCISTACFGDLNVDGVVDGADLGLLLGAWGSADETADVNNDGTVDGADLGLLLGAFGPCE